MIAAANGQALEFRDVPYRHHEGTMLEPGPRHQRDRFYLADSPYELAYHPFLS
jgi:hypothetical protein